MKTKKQLLEQVLSELAELKAMMVRMYELSQIVIDIKKSRMPR